MTRRVVVLSGRVASGKSSLADGLVSKHGALKLSTRHLLGSEAERRGQAIPADRRSLQEFGTFLDLETSGAWIVDALRRELEMGGHAKVVVVDSVRLATQLDALRMEFGRVIMHVHLTAFRADLEDRFAARNAPIDDNVTFEQVQMDSTEAQVESLASLSDLHVNTSTTDVQDVLVRCAAKIGMLAPLDRQLVDVIVGGQFGSEGKGNLAYFLAPEYDVLLRVGGPNAGHKVPTDPVVTHRSIPSGALANPTAKLLIGAGAIISTDVLAQEIADSGVSPDRISIDPQAMVVSKQDVADEALLKERIGSTGQGVGSALARKINGRSSNEVRLARDTPELSQFVTRPIVDILEEAFSLDHRVLLEGTQGTGLSLHHGEYPFVTSRDTSATGCLSEAGIGLSRVRKIVMVIRSFPIRVEGTSGPIGTEVDWKTVATRSGLEEETLVEAEKSSVQRKLRRVAEFDWKALRKSAELNTPTDIALTFADYLNASNEKAFRYDQLHIATREFVEEIEAVTSAPVSLISGRFTKRSVIDRRRWRGHVESNTFSGDRRP